MRWDDFITAERDDYNVVRQCLHQLASAENMCVNETMQSVLLKPLGLAWRGLRFAARWWPVGLVAIVLFLANVPGEERSARYSFSRGVWPTTDYCHGWPGTYLTRRPTDGVYPTCWQHRDGVLHFSVWILVGDLLVAGGLLVATALTTRWLRPLLRPRFSLTTALAGLAAISLLMGWAARAIAPQ